MRASHTSPVIANRKVHETLTLRRATRYGGFNALIDFVTAPGIDRALPEAFGRDKAPWATYRRPETLRHLLDGYLPRRRAGVALGRGRAGAVALRQARSRAVARPHAAVSGARAGRRPWDAEPAATGGRRAAPGRLGGPAVVHARLRLDGRDGLRRAGRGAAGAESPQAGPRVVPPAALPRAQERAHGLQSVAPGRHGLGDGGRRLPAPGCGPAASQPAPAGPHPSRSGVRPRGLVRLVRAARLARCDQAAGHGRPRPPHLDARGPGALARGRRRGRHAARGRRAPLPAGRLEPGPAGGADASARRRESPGPRMPPGTTTRPT